MDIRPLLHSYLRVARMYEQTADAGCKKTLGMFRRRLLKAGVRVLSYEDGEQETVVRAVVDGREETIRLPLPRPAGH